MSLLIVKNNINKKHLHFPILLNLIISIFSNLLGTLKCSRIFLIFSHSISHSSESAALNYHSCGYFYVFFFIASFFKKNYLFIYLLAGG